MNTFEDRLLEELKAVVADDRAPDDCHRHAPTPAVVKSRGRTVRRRAVYGLAAALAIGTAIALPTMTVGSQADAAPFQVRPQDDGSILFRVVEFSSPKSLELRLRELGANVVVDYVPLGSSCEEGRFREHEIPDAEMSAIYGWLEPLAIREGRLMTDDEIEFHRQGWHRLRPDLIPAGTTLVLTEGFEEDGEHFSSLGTFALAQGPVGPCELVPFLGLPTAT